tara:strand:+ start:519 stop:1814 length:1296 start_codon:yes stop_codon:yes gene_type:complete
MAKAKTKKHNLEVTCDPSGKLDRVPLDQIEPFQGDLKSLSETEYGKLKQSMMEKGFVAPVFAWKNGGDKWKLLDGHQRVRILEREKWEIDDGIPVVEISADNEKDAKEKLLTIVSRYGRVDGQGLYEFVADSGIDLDTWTVPDLPDLDIDAWLDEFIRDPIAPQGDPDEVPEPPEEPTAAVGDLWTLGDHRVLCGDATNADDVARLMDGEVPTLMVTDPPYGVEYDPEWREKYDKIKRHSVGKVSNDDRSDWTEAWALFSGDVAYIWSGDRHLLDIGRQVTDAKFAIRSLLIWAKQGFVFGRGHYHPQHEACIYAARKGATVSWIGGHKQSTVWEINNLNRMKGGTVDDINTTHSTQKPLECMERPIANHEGNVYDPFLGSGTTLIAAERQRRRCFGLEIEPKYVDVIVNRWEQYTGKTAVLTAANSDLSV